MTNTHVQTITIVAAVVALFQAGVLWYQGLDWFPMFVFSLVISLSARVIELERKVKQ